MPDIEVQADLFEDMMIFIYSPEYQEPEPPENPCPACGGCGISHTIIELYDDPFGDTWQDHIEVPCEACAGRGRLLEREAPRREAA